MKSNSGVSKPIILIGVAAIALSILLIWIGSPLRERKAVKNDGAPTEKASAPASISTDSAPLPQPAGREGELPPVIPISLAGLFTPLENDQWDKSAVFKLMPRGTQSFGGIEFWVEGMVQLQSKSSKDEKREYREKIVVPLLQTNVTASGIEIVSRGSNVSAVHLLGATRYENDGECSVAELVWRYTDGAARRTPIKFANHVRDWIRLPYEAPAYLPYPFSKAVWRAPMSGSTPRFVRLYRFSYANPEPAKLVRQLEFVSALAVPNLFLVGVTLDPVKLGWRPDDSPNLEPADSAPAMQIEVRVVTAEGQPIPNAKVRALIQQSGRPGSGRIDRTTMADNDGIARINYPPSPNLDRLEVGASHEDYGSRKMAWDTKAGDVIPASYTIKLSGGVSIGGRVVDESDLPIADAKLNFYHFWSGGEQMNRRGEQSDFVTRTTSSDAQGSWQMKGLPSDLLDHIGFRVNHADYVETNYTVGQNADIEKQLRAGTFKIALRRGLLATGKVTDEQGNPIAGATITAGQYNHSGTRDTKTDIQGEFIIGNLNAGEIQFSALAKGRKPEIKTVTITPAMPEILFQLGPGQFVRGIVKDEAGSPVSGVRIALESKTGGVSDTYPLELNSGSDGRFEWDGAPDEPQNFCFLKIGYESKRRQTLKLNEENVITIRHGRKIAGQVLDATTGEPVKKFRVGVGRYSGTDSFYADYPGMKSFADENGQFTMELNEEANNGIKAEADDYAASIEVLPEAQNGAVQIALRLKPSAALHGVVVTAEGAPVPGASVAFTTGKPGPGGVNLRNGRLSEYGGQNKIVTTDAKGEFVLPSPPESGMVVASAETGFVMSPIQQVRGSGVLVLQAFGQIEGTFKVAGQPVAGQEFMFSLMNVGVSLDFSGYKATTDDAGHFTISKVPAGAGQIVRLVKTSASSWAHSHNTDVVVEAGKTTQVTLGDTGAVLKGHVSFETPPADGAKLTISGNLSTAMPQRPQNFASSEEARAFYDSPEWKEMMKQVKRFSVSVNADGSLALDSIPPGTYTLNVTASKAGSRPWENPPVAQGSATVAVPDSASPFSPITIDEIVLKATAKPKTPP